MATAPKKSAYPAPIQPPSPRIQVTRQLPSSTDPGAIYTSDGAPGPQDTQQQRDGGMPTQAFHQMLTQLWQRVNGKNLFIPCTCTMPTQNNYVLTPMIQQSTGADTGSQANYEDYATYAFTAAGSSVTGTVTLRVLNLPALVVYHSNGATPSGNNDFIVDLQYFVTYCDILTGGAGGWVQR